eukprot:TRINITY_DN61354_c0_g1_i1.p2 TRINITY_DN61354_c0_g1~~TRINITY_DN61354_c0_g1_i1.p2  ORF type:complete len:110 (+),score=23.68 TRINITY_DN61354_c0_g1_i1:122-451(+)
MVVQEADNGVISEEQKSSYLMKVSVELVDENEVAIQGQMIGKTVQWLMLAVDGKEYQMDQSTEVQVWPFLCSSEDVVCGVNSVRGLVFLVAENRRVMIMELDFDEEVDV